MNENENIELLKDFIGPFSKKNIGPKTSSFLQDFLQGKSISYTTSMSLCRLEPKISRYSFGRDI